MLLALESQICVVIVLQKEFNRTMTCRRSTELSCLCVKPVWGTKSQNLNEIQSKTDKTWTWCCIIVSSHICWINFETDKVSFLENNNNKCFINFIQKKKSVGRVWANWNIQSIIVMKYDVVGLFFCGSSQTKYHIQIWLSEKKKTLHRTIYNTFQPTA